MRKKKVAEAEENGFAANRDRIDALASAVEEMPLWRPAATELREVRSVRTIFPQVDNMTRVLGWPIDRVGVVHGPSSEGKTLFVHGLGLSFLQQGHFYAYIDAEQTTPLSWVKKLFGSFSQHPGFRALRPSCYEEAVDATRQFCEVIGKRKEAGELPEDTTGLVVVDSLRKLNPKGMLDKLLKEGSMPGQKKGKGRQRGGAVGVDGMGGRAGQIKAAMNAGWLDEMIPLCARTGTAVVLVARETDDADADAFAREDFKVGGGKAVNYDASIRVRIAHASPVRDSTDGPIVGQRHAVELWKTKVAEREERVPMAYFHSSNGTVTPTGFDFSRDLLELACDAGIVDLVGSWYRWGQVKLGNGTGAAVRMLNSDAVLREKIEVEVRGCFKDARVVE